GRTDGRRGACRGQVVPDVMLLEACIRATNKRSHRIHDGWRGRHRPASGFDHHATAGMHDHRIWQSGRNDAGGCVRRILEAIVWFAMTAVLLGCAAVVVAIWWPDRLALMWALGLFSITMAVLTLREST